MPEKFVVFALGSLLSLTAVVGDSFIKHASLQPGFTAWRWLLAGFLFYGSTAFGWFFMMRKMKLSTLGIIFSITTIIFLTAVGTFYFKEKIEALEWVGILMGISSLLILFKFSA